MRKIEKLSLFENLNDESNLNEELENEFIQIINEGNRDFSKSIPNLEKIKKSINSRKYVALFYTPEKDKEESLDGFRLIEPYAVFKGTRSKTTGKLKNQNKIYVRAFVIMDTNKDSVAKKLFDGKGMRRKSVSYSNNYPYYRLFRFDRIESWRELEKTFSGYRDKYNPDDSLAGQLIASLDFKKFPKGKNPLK
jgi:predicted DNA-binding transcriptional regulator YafY